MISRNMEKYQDYLSDESELKGRADSISFPENLRQLQNILRELEGSGASISFQGSRTGICAAAVPEGGHIMNLSRMNRIRALRLKSEGEFILYAEPGLSLAELRQRLNDKKFCTDNWDQESLENLEKLKSSGKKYIFRPNPSESAASIGGMFSCNSKGMNSFAYGACADYTEELELCLINTELWKIKRGSCIFDEKGCILPDGGRIYTAHCGKAVSNILRARKGMDLIDFIAGSEGMLGAVTQLGLRLCEEKQYRWGIVLFSENINAAQGQAFNVKHTEFKGSLLSGIEIYDACALKIIDRARSSLNSLKPLPAFPEKAGAAVYIELEGDDAEGIDEGLMSIMDIFEQLGGSEDWSWASSYEKDIELFRSMRHCLPEAVRLPEFTGCWGRFSYDAQLPEERLCEFLEMYERDISENKLYAAVFGHYGAGRLHAEFLPRSENEAEKSEYIIKKWTEAVLNAGGLPAAENGIGKRKKYLNVFSDSDCLAEAKRIKQYFDPDMRLNPGNFFI